MSSIPMINRLSKNDFLTLMDFSIDEILTILDQSDEFKHALANKTSHEHLRGKNVAQSLLVGGSMTGMDILI